MESSAASAPRLELSSDDRTRASVVMNSCAQARANGREHTGVSRRVCGAGRSSSQRQRVRKLLLQAQPAPPPPPSSPLTG